jgi:hypothetical protein
VVQPVISKDKQPIHQLVIALVPTTIHGSTNLPTHIPRGSNHQPQDGGQPRYSHGGD